MKINGNLTKLLDEFDSIKDAMLTLEAKESAVKKSIHELLNKCVVTEVEHATTSQVVYKVKIHSGETSETIDKELVKKMLGDNFQKVVSSKTKSDYLKIIKLNKKLI